MQLVAEPTVAQPPLLPRRGDGLSVAIAGLALGGAERIVLDWATRIDPRWRVRLIVLRDHPQEWPVPDSLDVLRLNGQDVARQLGRLGREIAASPVPVCLCHLLRKPERDALAAGGAFVVPVLHNARAGWLEEASALDGQASVLTVSAAIAAELRAAGWKGSASVIRHLPPARTFPPESRERCRRAWNVPVSATVVGMIGAVKPQKDYPRAVRILAKLLERRDAYLVILGGPIGRDGRSAWAALLAEMERAGVRHRLALPGFVPDAARCLPAFDVLLNTSRYEGLSVATLEALAHRVPVVASRVGGQGEIGQETLALLPPEAPPETWVEALERALAAPPEAPAWLRFPAYRLWTLAALARPVGKSRKVLFVTANLNAGGAQRSLVHLAKALRGRCRFEIAVAGNSTASYFLTELASAGVRVTRTADSRDVFDHAEVLTQRIGAESIGTVCFWNVDPKLKILLVKTLQFTRVRFVDVSPGAGSFAEMRGIAEFQRLVGFDERAYYRRLDHLVQKYRGEAPPECAGKAVVIPNGVPRPRTAKTDYSLPRRPRVVVQGRIAPAKFLLEILAALRIVRAQVPGTELHVYGVAEPRHRAYAEAVAAAAAAEPDGSTFFHGPCPDIATRLPEFDACVVLGEDQGCPNALLEALAVGLPAVANDSGGTREQLIHGVTGLLLEDRCPAAVAAALVRVLQDREVARTLGREGRGHVLRSFSMRDMARSYARLFGGRVPSFPPAWLARCVSRITAPASLPATRPEEATP
jgi:glycosyltransferase involved in cell wall biosynthesis